MDDLTLGKECDRRAEKLVDEWFKLSAHSGTITMYGLGLLKQEIAKEFRRLMQPLVGIREVTAIVLERKTE